MKVRFVVVALGSMFAVSSWTLAQTSGNTGAMPGMGKGSSEMKGGMDMKGMNMPGEGDKNKSGSTVHKINGTVKEVDVASKTVTLDHGPVKTLNWPAMSMKFKVDDKVSMDKLRQGTKVDVDVVQRGKDYVVTAVKE